jgi:hypothetical protein
VIHGSWGMLSGAAAFCRIWSCSGCVDDGCVLGDDVPLMAESMIASLPT